jgi:hypothetical protein
VAACVGPDLVVAFLGTKSNADAADTTVARRRHAAVVECTNFGSGVASEVEAGHKSPKRNSRILQWQCAARRSPDWGGSLPSGALRTSASNERACK